LVKLAKTEAEREKGLMFQNQLNQEEGMLFIFGKEGAHPFWMKNVLIPLDMIWIDKNSKVIFINKNSQPCREDNCPMINPGVFSKYVLEINAGNAKKLGIEIGDIASLKLYGY
jgi:hypothetical protein